MRATLCFLLVLLVTFAVHSEELYTVILKNGKTMKGQLLSEKDDLIVFKDEKGIQYSLKKSLLDLENMKLANEPPAPPTETTEPEVMPEQTNEQPETNPEPVPQSQPMLQSNPEQTPIEISTQPSESISTNTQEPSNSYLGRLQEATKQLEASFEEVGSLLDGMLTAWEVNASTGKNPALGLQEYKATKGMTLAVSIQAKLQVLENLRQSLSSSAGLPPDDPSHHYIEAINAFTTAVQELNQYFDSVRQYEGKPAVSVLRSRLSTTEQSIQKKIDELRAMK